MVPEPARRAARYRVFVVTPSNRATWAVVRLWADLFLRMVLQTIVREALCWYNRNEP